MRIRELEDVLVLVDELPVEKQKLGVKMLIGVVEDWEAQQAEGVDDIEWMRIRAERSCENLKLLADRVERAVRKTEKGPRKRRPR